MNALIKLIAATGIVASSAAPVFAEAHVVDPATMTCAEFSAMDGEGMMAATHTMDMAMAMTDEEMTAAMAMSDEEKAAMQAEADAATAAMTEEETTAAMAETETSMAAMVAACATAPDGTVMDAMKSAM